MILLLCGCHLALPWTTLRLTAAGRRMARNGFGGPALTRWVVRAQRNAQGIYDTGTMLLAAAACAWAMAGADTVAVRTGGPAMFVAAAVIGAAVPLGFHRVARRSVRWSGPPAPGAAGWLVGCAAGEELLWRVCAPAALGAVGASWWWAQLCAGAGFVLLHLPTVGRRGIGYQAVLTALLVAVYHYGGLPSVLACHVLHNIVVTGIRTVPAANPVPIHDLPESRTQW